MNEFVALNQQLSKSPKEIATILKCYQKALDNINNEIAIIARRYHTEGTIPKSSELRDGQLDTLQRKILNHIQKLGQTVDKTITNRLSGAVNNGYYKTLYKIGRKINFATDFNALNFAVVDKVLSHKYDSKDYSERIWDNTAKLAVKAKECVDKAVVTGKSTERLSRELSKEFDTSFYNASRLVNTETARCVNEGQVEAYKATGLVQKVMWDATLESNTCEKCSGNDGKQFDIDKAPYLPMHPCCRCCLIPVVDDWTPTQKIDNESKEIIKYKNYDEWYNDKYGKAIAKQDNNAIINVSDSGSTYVSVTNENVQKVGRLNITDDDNLNTLHQQECKNLLKQVSTHKVGTEISIVLDDKMKRIDGFNYVIGEIGQTKIDKPNVKYHAIHNHGSGETFSFDDLQHFANKDNMLSLTVQGNDGRNYCISTVSNSDRMGYVDFLNTKSKEVIFSVDDIDFTYQYVLMNRKECMKIISTLNEKQITEFKNNLKQFSEDCAKGCEKYGFKYSKT